MKIFYGGQFFYLQQYSYIFTKYPDRCYRYKYFLHSYTYGGKDNFFIRNTGLSYRFTKYPGTCGREANPLRKSNRFEAKEFQIGCTREVVLRLPLRVSMLW